MNTRLFVLVVGSAFAGAGLATLIDAAAKGFVLFSLATVVAFASSRASAATRHLVWFAALLCSLVLPLCALMLPQWRVLPKWGSWQEVSPRISTPEPLATPISMPQETFTAAPAVSPATAETEVPILLPPLEIVTPPISIRNDTAPDVFPARINPQIVLIVWMIGAVMLLLPLLYSFVALWRISKRSQPVASGVLLDALQELQRELDLRREVHLLLGREDAMPMVWGIFRVRLLLPSSAATWAPSRLRGVLLHELAHLRRRDPLSMLLAQLALAVHWFNPLAWFAVRQLRAEQERACDDYVLRHGVLASDYATDLLAVASGLRPVSLAASALTMARPSRLEGRIIGILDVARNRRALTQWLVVAAGLVSISIALPLAMLRAEEEGTKPDEKNAAAPQQGGTIQGMEEERAKILKVTTSTDSAQIEVEERAGRLALIVGEGESARIVAHDFSASKRPIVFRAGADDRKGKWWDQVRFGREGESDGLIPILPEGWMPAGRIVFLPAPVNGPGDVQIIAEISSETMKVPLAVRAIGKNEGGKFESWRIPATSPETEIHIDGRIHALREGAPEKPLKLPVMAAQDMVGLPREALSFPSLTIRPGFSSKFARMGSDAEQMNGSAVSTADGIRVNGAVSVTMLPGKYSSAREAWNRNEESLRESGSKARETKKLRAEFSATLGGNDALVFSIPSEGLFPEALVVSLTALPRKVSRIQWFPPEHPPKLVFDGWVLTWPRMEHEWFSQQFDYKDGIPEAISRRVNDRKAPPGNSVTSESIGFMDQVEVEALLEAFRKRPGLKVERVEPFVAKQPKIPGYFTEAERTHFMAGGSRAIMEPRFDGRYISPSIRWQNPVFKHRNASSAYAVWPGSSLCMLLPGPADPDEIRMLVLRCAVGPIAPKKDQNPPKLSLEAPWSPDAQLSGGRVSFFDKGDLKLSSIEPSALPREVVSTALLVQTHADESPYRAALNSTHHRYRALDEQRNDYRKLKPELPADQEREYHLLLGQLLIDDPVWALGQQIQADIDALVAVRSRTPSENALLENLKDFIAITTVVEDRAATRKEAEQFASTLRQFIARRDVAGARSWASRNKD